MSITASVERITTITPEIVSAFEKLTPQVSSRATLPSSEELASIVSNPGVSLFVARITQSGEIIGAITLVIFNAIAGKRAWLQDLVVDEASRGQGIASILLSAALNAAKEEHVRTVDMTSRPTREDGNKLYAHLGFEKRETNVYRVTFP